MQIGWKSTEENYQKIICIGKIIIKLDSNLDMVKMHLPYALFGGD